MPNPIRTRYHLETTFATKGASGTLHRLTDAEAGLRVTVAPFAGAEIASLQVRLGNTWMELLDRAEDFTPCDRWRGRAPWLWPAVGRTYAPAKLAAALQKSGLLDELEWDCDGRIYPMPIHGFAMNREWRVVNASIGDQGVVAEYALMDDSQTRQCYPFGFIVVATYHLADGQLNATVRVEAAKGNSSPMPFCIGNHLTLRLPFTKVGQFNEVTIYAPVRRVHRVTRLGLLGETEELSFREGPRLADPRLHDLVVGHFPLEQATLRVVDPGGIEIEIGQRELTSGRSRIPHDGLYFVFYASPQHGFFCPEP